MHVPKHSYLFSIFNPTIRGTSSPLDAVDSIVFSSAQQKYPVSLWIANFTRILVLRLFCGKKKSSQFLITHLHGFYLACKDLYISGCHKGLIMLLFFDLGWVGWLLLKHSDDLMNGY